jgi:hypothetical protein
LKRFGGLRHIATTRVNEIPKLQGFYITSVRSKAFFSGRARSGQIVARERISATLN